MVKKAVHSHYLECLKNEMKSQPSAKYVNPHACSFYQPHNIWSMTSPKARDVTRAMLKVKILLGVYNLEGKRAKFKKQNLDGTCPLCHTDIETREHFIINCSALQSTRESYLEEMAKCVDGSCELYTPTALLNEQTLTQIILDPSRIIRDSSVQSKLEDISRRLLYALHARRTVMIDGQFQPTSRSSAAAHPAERGVRLIKAGCRTSR